MHKKVSVILGLSVLLSGCTPSSAAFSVPEEYAVIRYLNLSPVFDVKKVNEVLERKNYPYRLESVDLREYGDNREMSREEEHQLTETAISDCDLTVQFAYNSINVMYYRDGILSELDDELKALLPKEMYRTADGAYVEFPSNFFSSGYVQLNPDVYYAIVKDEIAEDYGIRTYEDLMQYILQCDQCSFGNAHKMIFDLNGKSEFDLYDWKSRIGWDEEIGRFYNIYREETEHIRAVEKYYNMIFNNSQENQADIIFGVPVKEGYTGIAYQPYPVIAYGTGGFLFSKDCSPYAMQFVKDLYTDTDLTNAAVPPYVFDDCICFGNLEILDPEILKENYEIDTFCYRDFVDSLSGKRSGLFGKEIDLIDVCTEEQFWSLLEGEMTIGVRIPETESLQDQILDYEPEWLESVIDELNRLYQESEE